MRKQSKEAKARRAAKERRQEVQEAWRAENTERITIRFNKHTDADILQQLDGVESKQGEVKRLVRLGMAAERKEGDA